MTIIQMQENTILNGHLSTIATRETHQLLSVDGGPIPAIRWLAFQSSVMQIAGKITGTPEGLSSMNWFAPININSLVNRGPDKMVEDENIRKAEKNTQRLQQLLSALAGEYFGKLGAIPMRVITDNMADAQQLVGAALASPAASIDKVHNLTEYKLEDMAQNHTRGDYNPAHPVAYLAAHYQHYRKPGIHISPGSEEQFIRMLDYSALPDTMNGIYPGITQTANGNLVLLSEVRRVPYYIADPNEPSLNEPISMATLSKKGAVNGVNGYVGQDNLHDLTLLWQNLAIEPTDQRGQVRLIELVNDTVV